MIITLNEDLGELAAETSADSSDYNATSTHLRDHTGLIRRPLHRLTSVTP
jgi:hypothetical protein